MFPCNSEDLIIRLHISWWQKANLFFKDSTVDENEISYRLKAKKLEFQFKNCKSLLKNKAGPRILAYLRNPI